MADINIIKTRRNGSVLFLTTQGEAEQTYAPSSHEDRNFIYVENTHTKQDIEVVFAIGDGAGMLGKAHFPAEKLSVTVKAGDKMLIGPLESKRFINNCGKNAGRIVITTSPKMSAYLKFAAIELP